MMRKFLVILIFIVASLVTAVVFVTATSYTQLVLACLFYPPIAYFIFMFFPRKPKTIAVAQQPTAAATIQPVAAAEETVGIVDTDKRAFLKLIGAAGLSLFLFSIFNRRAEGLFFGKAGTTSLEDIDGNKISPAERQPTDGYQICEIDDTYTAYYGFINKEGAWYIMKQDPDTGSVRYVRGDANFPDSWNTRENLSYDYFSTVF